MDTEYKKILEETVVPSTLSVEEANLKYDSLANYLFSKMPNRLYRFREFNDYSVSALNNNQLWLSSGDTMNDSFDARIYYDKNKVRDWYNSLIASDGGLAPVEHVLQNDAAPEEFQKVPGGEWIYNQIKSVPQDAILAYSKKLLEIIRNDIEDGLKSITNYIQGSTRFACLTGDIDSDKMWGSYSKNGTGFAIGYDFKANTIVKSGGFVCLYPILYMDERIDGTSSTRFIYISLDC